jgi:hypothetical protein
MAAGKDTWREGFKIEDLRLKIEDLRYMKGKYKIIS